jgi:hypothetical protein
MNKSVIEVVLWIMAIGLVHFIYGLRLARRSRDMLEFNTIM